MWNIGELGVKTRGGATSFSRVVIAAVAALFASAAFGGELVWDATGSGRLMTATNDMVLFKGAKLAEMRPARCWFNKAQRRRADGTWTMCNGEGRICHVRRAEDGE